MHGFGIYALLGVAGGFVSVVFTKLLLWMRARSLRSSKKTVLFQPVAGGLNVGMMGWFMPQLLGVGYKHVGEVLKRQDGAAADDSAPGSEASGGCDKFASGNAGGIFGPSLFLGAMRGGIVGNVTHGLFPTYVATPGAYALVGMGTAFAGIVRAPMTSVVMIFEITRDYAVIVPLMISNLVSFFISSRFQKQPIYEVPAHQDGIHLPNAETRQQEGQRQVVHAMRDATEVLRAEMTVQEALEKSRSSELRAWPVCDKCGVIGFISLQKLKRLNNDGPTCDRRTR